MIEVKEGKKCKTLPKNAGHVLVYDKKDDSYYAVEYDHLFRAQKESIERIESDYREKISAIRKENDEFREDMTQKFNQLLESYKKLSANLIGLVEQEVKKP